MRLIERLDRANEPRCCQRCCAAVSAAVSRAMRGPGRGTLEALKRLGLGEMLAHPEGFEPPTF